jgi:hypothetical protein
MKRLLIYYSFIIVSLIVVVGFISSTNYIQLIAAALFFPLFVYFASRVFPRKIRAIHLPKEPVIVIQSADKKLPQKIDPEITKLKKEGVDIDRRMFLKLIGSAGLSLFLFSLFTKRAEAAFFGSAPGPGVVALKDSSGNKIDPAERQPTDGYKITDIDDSSPAYYGFVNKNGAWFIQREGVSGDYRYIRGSSNYSTNWTNRTSPSLTYDYFDNVF